MEPSWRVRFKLALNRATQDAQSGLTCKKMQGGFEVIPGKNIIIVDENDGIRAGPTYARATGVHLARSFFQKNFVVGVPAKVKGARQGD